MDQLDQVALEASRILKQQTLIFLLQGSLSYGLFNAYSFFYQIHVLISLL